MIIIKGYERVLLKIADGLNSVHGTQTNWSQYFISLHVNPQEFRMQFPAAACNLVDLER